MKQITVNGQSRETCAPDVAALVAELCLVKGAILVEHNGMALRPAEWNERILSGGDRIEILRLAAGG